MSADPTNTITFQMTPLTQGGYPNVVDDHFLTSVAEGKKGGASTQSFFDSINQTSDFWGWMADHDGTNTNPFVPATDSDGNPIVIASNGNVSMRMGVFYNEDATVSTGEEDSPTPVGIGTIQTGNTTTMLSRDIALAVGLLEVPVGFKLTKALWADLVGPLYNNMKTLITKTAKQFQQKSQVEDPSIVAESDSIEPISETEEELIPLLGQPVEEGAEYLAVGWGSTVLDVAGLGAIAAIPLIISYLGHKMINSLTVINQTSLDFTWAIGYQASGQPSVLPSADGGSTTSSIPQMEMDVDIWGDSGTATVAYEADFQFMNSNDYGSIGYVMSFSPSDHSTAAQLVVSIPWMGDNTIWVGASNENPVAIYDTYSATNGQLTMTTAFDTYQVTVAINTLSGQTNGQYFYGVLVVIEPLAG